MSDRQQPQSLVHHAVIQAKYPDKDTGPHGMAFQTKKGNKKEGETVSGMGRIWNSSVCNKPVLS